MDQEILVQPLPLSSSKLPLILIGLALILSAGVGGVYLGKYLYSPKTPATIQTTPSGIPSNFPTIDPTADWETYTGNEFVYPSKHKGYSFRYPRSWQLTTNNLLEYKTSSGKTWKIKIDAGGHGGPDGEIKILRNESRQYPGGEVDIAIEEVVNQRNVIGTYWFPGETQPSSPIFGFEIISLPPEDLEEFEAVFDQILSTVQFID